MDLEFLRDLLGLSALISYGFLLLWWLMYMCLRDWMCALGGRMFRVSEAELNRLHISGMMHLKLLVGVFQLAPFLALLILLD